MKRADRAAQVIGLLGGRWVEEAARLEILLAVACRIQPHLTSLVQCEIDPLSELHARDVIESHPGAHSLPIA
jgi:hypothetical protein